VEQRTQFNEPVIVRPDRLGPKPPFAQVRKKISRTREIVHETLQQLGIHVEMWIREGQQKR